MNRNKVRNRVRNNATRKMDLKKKMTAGLAVSMAGLMGTMPVFAADPADNRVSKDETVYVNADANGTEQEITVSNWLKNAGTQKNLKDETELENVKNVKGDETFEKSKDAITWQTNGADIYYQGTTDKELPVSMKMTYYLDGKEMSPEALKGQSGHLKIRIDYKNHAKKTVKVDGKKQDVYSPFVMVTGLILPDETFSNVVIDNGKVISDGQKNMVMGIAMPGLKESLGLNSADFKEVSDDIQLPESVEITADVTDFKMGATFTIALSDLLDEMDWKNVTDFDTLKNSLNDLEDAALQLVDGSSRLSEGAETLGSSYEEFDQGVQTLKDGINTLQSGTGDLKSGVDSYTAGADQLNAGIQQYLGANGELNVKVTEYVNGVNKVVKGVEDYTAGASQLSEGITSYIGGEQQLAAGAAQLTALKDGLIQTKDAVGQLYEAIDGAGGNDIQAASEKLAEGTQKLKDAVDGMNGLLAQVDTMTATGQQLITQTEGLSKVMQEQIAVPVQKMLATGQKLMELLGSLTTQLETINADSEASLSQAKEAMVNGVNAQIAEKNGQIAAVNNAAAAANAQVEAVKAQISSQIAAAEANGNTELAASLQSALAAVSGISVDAGISELAPVAVSDNAVKAGAVDVSQLKALLENMQKSFGEVEGTVKGLMPQLAEMQKKMDEITAMKDQIPVGMTDQLKDSVSALNTGMQGLYAAIGSYADNVKKLNEGMAATVPDASQGIDQLHAGFAQLNAANDALLQGAAKLQQNTPVLVSGVQTLAGGTTELSGGLNQLGTQLSSGGALLAGNSQALREGVNTLVAGTNKLSDGGNTLASASGEVKNGIAQLSDGASQLKDGAEKFNEEGIKKLQKTVEDALEKILDKVDALTSEDCAYDTYSGKADNMDGNVKFIIETDAIE